MSTPATTTTATGAQATAPTDKIVVHHLQDSRSQRVIWLLETLGVPYEVKQYMRINGRAPVELLKVSPFGKSPVITDGPTVTVSESGAILEYLADKFDGTARTLLPKSDSQGDVERRAYTFWMHFAEGSMMGTLVLKMVFATARPQIPFFVRPIFDQITKGLDKQYMDPDIKQHYDFIEATLAKTEWFAGDKFTVADVQMSFPMEIADRGGLTETSHPKIYAWRRKVAAMKSYRDALTAGGMRYDYALPGSQ